MKPGRRKSKQREQIYALIKNTTVHPTALWIYDALRKDSPSLSMGNVYRNIRILIEEGRISCRDFGDGVEHYDAVVDLHYHFICEICNEITDFELPVPHDIEAAAKKITDKIIKSHTIQFFGICEKCKQP